MNNVVYLVFLLSLTSIVTCNEFKKILLNDVHSLTFLRNHHAIGRRRTIPKMDCIGGSAAKANYIPDFIHCLKLDNSTNPQWSCSANLDKKYQLGEVTVICEGYDFPGDVYITDGSCGIQYHLELQGTTKETVYLSGFVVFLLVLYVGWYLQHSAKNKRRRVAGKEENRFEGVIVAELLFDCLANSSSSRSSSSGCLSSSTSKF